VEIFCYFAGYIWLGWFVANSLFLIQFSFKSRLEHDYLVGQMDRNQVNSLFKFFQDVSALKATVSKTYHGLASLKNSFKFDDVDGYITRALPVPEIVLLGEQSSGKSSFIEALVGDKFNFAQAGMATKIKMFVTVLVDPELKENKWEFKANGKWLVGTKEGVIRMLAEENTSKFSFKPSKITV
jgi:hypothetical protein